jgi:hypothetical protein
MTEQPNTSSASTKKLFVVSAGATAGAALILVVLVSSVVWYANRPAKARPWNQTAVTAAYSNLYLTTGRPLVFTFRYTLDNHTGLDYQLPGNESIYKVLAEGKGLDRDARLKWEGGTTVLAGQKVVVGIHVEYDYTDDDSNDEKLAAFAKRALSEIDGFAALDQLNRYEIRFPKPSALAAQP